MVQHRARQLISGPRGLVSILAPRIQSFVAISSVSRALVRRLHQLRLTKRMQNHLRGWAERQRFLAIRNGHRRSLAARCNIASLWRMMQDRATFLVRMVLLTRVQARVRGQQQWRAYIGMRRAIVRLQAWMRMCMQRRRHQRRVLATSHMQRLFRFQLWKYTLRVAKGAASKITRWVLARLTRWRLREWTRQAEMATAKGHTADLLQLLRCDDAQYHRLRPLTQVRLLVRQNRSRENIDKPNERTSIVVYDLVNLSLSRTYGTTLLHVAAKHGQSEAVALLLQSKASPDRWDRVRETPLHVSVGRGDDALTMSKALYRAGQKWVAKKPTLAPGKVQTVKWMVSSSAASSRGMSVLDSALADSLVALSGFDYGAGTGEDLFSEHFALHLASTPTRTQNASTIAWLRGVGAMAAGTLDVDSLVQQRALRQHEYQRHESDLKRKLQQVRVRVERRQRQAVEADAWTSFFFDGNMSSPIRRTAATPIERNAARTSTGGDDESFATPTKLSGGSMAAVSTLLEQMQRKKHANRNNAADTIQIWWRRHLYGNRPPPRNQCDSIASPQPVEVTCAGAVLETRASRVQRRILFKNSQMQQQRENSCVTNGEHAALGVGRENQTTDVWKTRAIADRRPVANDGSSNGEESLAEEMVGADDDWHEPKQNYQNFDFSQHGQNMDQYLRIQRVQREQQQHYLEHRSAVHLRNPSLVSRNEPQITPAIDLVVAQIAKTESRSPLERLRRFAPSLRANLNASTCNATGNNTVLDTDISAGSADSTSSSKTSANILLDPHNNTAMRIHPHSKGEVKRNSHTTTHIQAAQDSSPDVPLKIVQLPDWRWNRSDLVHTDTASRPNADTTSGSEDYQNSDLSSIGDCYPRLSTTRTSMQANDVAPADVPLPLHPMTAPVPDIEDLSDGDDRRDGDDADGGARKGTGSVGNGASANRSKSWIARKNFGISPRDLHVSDDQPHDRDTPADRDTGERDDDPNANSVKDTDPISVTKEDTNCTETADIDIAQMSFGPTSEPFPDIAARPQSVADTFGGEEEYELSEPSHVEKDTKATRMEIPSANTIATTGDHGQQHNTVSEVRLAQVRKLDQFRLWRQRRRESRNRTEVRDASAPAVSDENMDEPAPISPSLSALSSPSVTGDPDRTFGFGPPAQRDRLHNILHHADNSPHLESSHSAKSSTSEHLNPLPIATTRPRPDFDPAAHQSGSALTGRVCRQLLLRALVWYTFIHRGPAGGWYYRDLEHAQFGPFSSSKMYDWLSKGVLYACSLLMPSHSPLMPSHSALMPSHSARGFLITIS